VIFGHTPAGTSQGTFLHYGQGFLSGKFSKYDYGVDKNMERYNQSTPPRYALSKITAPVALYWSFNDLLADEQVLGKLCLLFRQKCMLLVYEPKTNITSKFE
jgi:lysosomal acid lipase/cholesteryl ester hydrolase